MAGQWLDPRSYCLRTLLSYAYLCHLFLNEKQLSILVWKKRPYWLNNFSCILHMRWKIIRQLAATNIFSALFLLKKPFRRMKASFQKKFCWSKFWHIFKIWNFSDLCNKSLNSDRIKTFSWNNIKWYAFYSNFATFNDLFWKISHFFERNPSIFSKNTQTSYIFEKPYYFSSIPRQFC